MPGASRGGAVTELRLRAEEALAEARILLAAGRPNGAINRAYYAAFTAARVIVARPNRTAIRRVDASPPAALTPRRPRARRWPAPRSRPCR
ncbi:MULTISPECIES: HEPN domain-containing protein [Methylobacterium]|uniref:HEPN domain-containing protein n=1 Tax=Methylobacterium TaxID=407 RepID=UPI0013EA30EE|nr:HEPN domain-containing protein [Methylobacterium sp. DB0501]NGM33598.1 HEPN domain-containing protein [Methylobacterium sp. DB0501]